MQLFLVFSLAVQAAYGIQPYGSKTPYNHGNLSEVETPPGCKPVHINMLARHGERYPSSDDLKAFAAFLQKLNVLHNTTGPYIYKALTLPWTLPASYKSKLSSELSVAGERQHYGIARRYHARYPSVFSKQYWNADYEFVSTATLRTVQSGNSFAYGLFEGRGPVGRKGFQPVAIRFSGPKDHDKVLRPYSMCPRYDQVVDGRNGMLEPRKFAQGSEMQRVISNVKSRLGMPKNAELNVEVVEKMFMLCAFLTVNDNDTSWCSLFEEEDLNVLEYYLDMWQYYEHGYGHEITYKSICPLVAEIAQTIKSFTKKKIPNGIFRFAHSGGIISLQSILSLYRDPIPLTAGNYHKLSNRTFRIARNAPMSSNIAFVLHECTDGYKVQVLVNERLTVLPCCKSAVCKLDKFLECYEAIGSNCDLEKMCKLDLPNPKSDAVLFARGQLVIMILCVTLSFLRLQ